MDDRVLPQKSHRSAKPKLAPRPGELDTTFGTDGYLYLEEPGNAGYYPPLYACATDINSQIYVVMENTPFDWVITRLNRDGEVDTTFGNMDGHKGYTRLPNLDDPHFACAWFRIVITGDDSVIVLGIHQAWEYPVACRVMRDGTVDPSFGNSSANKGIGYYPLPSPPSGRSAKGFMSHPSSGKNGARHTQAALSADPMQTSVLADGSLLFLARIHDSSYLFKIDRQGRLDPAFAGTGYVLVGDFLQPIYTFQVENTHNGHIVVAGQHGPSTGIVRRYEPRGYLDVTFGIGGGVEITDPAWSCTCRDVRTTVDGRFIVLVALFGAGFPLPHQATGLVALDRNGRRDPTFNGGNLAVVDLMQERFISTELAVDSGSRSLVGGNALRLEGISLLFSPMIARFMGNGRLDPSFGDNGISRAIGADDGTDRLSHIAVQYDEVSTIPPRVLVMVSAEINYLARLWA
ncbi:hypothetical protein [Dyella monticola]|nr:hypothetical protein [Dyella monticola]